MLADSDRSRQNDRILVRCQGGKSGRAKMKALRGFRWVTIHLAFHTPSAHFL
jgi:hypothetical protein